jgi:hypothetical protein
MLLVSLVFLQTPMTAQPSWYFNFGCKLGYVSGIFGEYIGGIELSVTRWPENSKPAAGACISVEQSTSFIITHVGFEIIGGGVGASLGPSLVIYQGQRDVALAATAWGGLVILPYLRNTWRPGQSSIPEFGAFMKIPKLISGPKIR